jgi:dethiobiotin synthetase
VKLLVTGTDTGVGKTFITAALIRSARSLGIDCVGMKPICSGGNEDVLSLRAAAEDVEPEHLINPVWFRTPVAPYAASIIEGRLIDLESIRNAFQELASRHAWVLVEGAGGLTAPISSDYDFRDLARDLGLSVIVVAANRLGTINHIRLTLQALKSAKLKCEMVILNELEPPLDPSQLTNFGLLQILLRVPILLVEQNQTNLSRIVEKLRR